MRFVAFPVTEYDEVLLGYQPGQMVEQWANQRFKDHLCPHPQGTTRLIAQENFIISVYMFVNSTVS